MEKVQSLVNTISTRGMVDKATSDDEEPTPGYLYKELSDLTHASVAQSQTLQDCLIQKLLKDSFNVKLKALRVIKHILQTGHYSFRRDLQRRTETLRACTTYRGPPDPLRGETPYRLVREEAQLVMNALFLGEDKPEAVRPTMPGTGNSVVSPPSSASSLSAASTFSSGSAPAPGRKYMEGFGNTPAVVPKQQGFLGVMVNAVQKVSEFTVEVGHSITGSNPTSNMSGTGHLPSSASSFQSSTYYSSSLPSSSVEHQRGVPGGSWATESPAAFAVLPPSGLEPTPPARTSIKPPNSDEELLLTPATKTIEVPHTDGVVEKRLVDEITASTGVRVLPTSDSLLQFCSRCASLSPTHVANNLVAKLSSPAWQVQLKSLCAIESLLDSERSELYRTAFEPHLSTFQHFRNSTQKAITERSTKILAHLGVYQSEQKEPTTTTGEEGTSTPKKKKEQRQPSEVVVAPAASSDILDIFEGLSVSATEAPKPSHPSVIEKKPPSGQQSNGDLLGDFLSTPTQPATTAPSYTSFELDFLQDPEPRPTKPTVTPTSAPMAPTFPTTTYVVPFPAKGTPQPVAYVAPTQLFVKPNYAALSAPPPGSEGFQNIISKQQDGFDFVQDEIKRQR